ncbi:MAG TPA: NAD(P)/FAD-dependent oxidoreductase [Actinomycetota bacterium]
MPAGRRSPIDRAMRDLVQVHLRGGDGGAMSVDDAVHRASAISRRNFLRYSAVAAGSAVLASCTTGSGADQPSVSAAATGSASGDGPRVVIVGAGLAGLTAAYRLHQAGVASQVYEARDRIGGRCWSARDWQGGQVCEHGGEFIDTRHVHIRGIADELGLTLDDLWASWDPSWHSPTWVDGEEVQPKEILAPMDQAAKEIARIVTANGSYLATDATPAAIAFDAMSEAEWITEATGESMDSAMGRLITQHQAGWYGLDPDQLGATNLLDFYATDWPGADERYTTNGGNDQIPQGLYQALPEGSVTLETPLESVHRRSDGTYEARFGGLADPVVADRLIITVPFNVLKDVDMTDAGLSELKQRAIQELSMGTNAKILMQFDRPFADFDSWSGSVQRADDPIWGTWESGTTDGKDAQGYGMLTVYPGGRVGASYDAAEPHDVAPRSVVDSTLASLDEMVPGLRGAAIGDAWLDFWAIDPWVGGSYAAFGPGDTTSFWGLTGTPEGAMHLAGEHTSVYSQGYLNGGVESGGRAAAEVLEALGIENPPGLAKALRQQQRYEPVYAWT